MQRVVVTGMGAITPLGLDVPATWDALIAGRSGVDYITHFSAEGFETKFAAEVKDFDATKYMDRKEARRMDRFVHFAIAAAREAMAQSRLTVTPENAEEIGCIIGSGIGGIATLSEQFRVLSERGPGRVSPFLVPMMIVDMASGQTSIQFGTKGPNYCTVSACSSGSDAIGDAYEIIRRGDAVAMICGGAEASITPIGISGFNAVRALSTRNDRPHAASRPFDARRDGFVMGEGAGILVIESLEHAQQRGAHILAELAGYGSTADAHHITQPAENGEGGVRAMRLALRKAGLAPHEVEYVNCHGTSTPMNDRFETLGLKGFFGEHAYKLATNSTKSMTGHLIGAAGAVEAIVCVQSILTDTLHPTINYENPDPACDLDCVPNQARRMRVDVAMSNSFGFGGHNASLVFRRFRDA